MMSLETYAAFVAASILLIVIPGPNVALIAANSLRHGKRSGLMTVFGTSLAMVPQLVLTIMGMSTLLGLLAEWFEWIRWLGVAYLVLLAVQTWRAPAVDLSSVSASEAAHWKAFWQGFIVSAANPKVLLFYAVFFPQFVTPGVTLTQQLSLMAVTFLGIAHIFNTLWAIFSARLRPWLQARPKMQKRMTMGCLLGAGLGLAASRAP
jgi:homoserine/homoserine lactone efflux protein